MNVINVHGEKVKMISEYF